MIQRRQDTRFPLESGRPVIIVAEGFRQFYLEDQQVRFVINLNVASQAGLKISAKLLAMSQIVKS
jgi:hypothetical protein